MSYKLKALGAAASALMVFGVAGGGLASADNDPDGISGPDTFVVTGNAATLSALCGGVCWSGGGGTFNSSQPPACMGILSDPSTDGPEVAPRCGVTGFSGTFTNTICGTGTADGSATGITETGDLGNPGKINFHIDFIGGTGLLRDNGGSTEQGDTAGTTNQVTYFGIVVLLPPNGTIPIEPNPNAAGFGPCVRSFDVGALIQTVETGGP